MDLTHFPRYDEYDHRVEMADSGEEGSVYVDDLYAGYVCFEREIQEWRATTLKPDDHCFKTKDEAVDHVYTHYTALDATKRLRNSIIENFPTPGDFHYFMMECLLEGLRKDEMYGDAITEEVDTDVVCHDLLIAWTTKYKNRRENWALDRKEKTVQDFGVELLNKEFPIYFRVNGVLYSLSKRQIEDLLWIQKVLESNETPQSRSIRLSCCHRSSLRVLHRKNMIIWRSDSPYREVITTSEGYGLVRLLKEIFPEEACESLNEKK